MALPDKVSREGWAEAERNAATLPFYIGPRMIGQPEAEQTAAAIPIVLHDRPEAAPAPAAVQGAETLAARFQLQGTRDSLLVLAACRSFYGDAFDQGGLAWTPEVFGAGLSPSAVVNALRLRLALDFARFV